MMVRMIELAILGLLDEAPLLGYEIRRRLRAQLGLIANVSFGSLYPALQRMLIKGWVVAEWGVTAGNRRAGPGPPAAGAALNALS